MKGLIIYKGKYGATRQYAWWLKRELGLPMVSADKVLTESIIKHDYLLIGSSVYIGKLQVKKWLKKNLALLRGKKIFFFIVAGASPEEKEKRESYVRAGVPEELRKNCMVFHLPGRMIMDELSGWDRFMLKMGARLTKDPKAKKEMLTDYDQVQEEYLAGMIKEVNKYLAPSLEIKAGTWAPSLI